MISYPMLPEIEKGIPKPLKKRYRDLFEDDANPSNIDNIQNVSSNKVGSFAFAQNASHIAVKKENSNCQLHRPSNLYRKSVIKRSITKHISIIDIEQITPAKSSNNANTLTRTRGPAGQSGEFQIDTDESRSSHFVYLSDDYLVNSPVQFVGKLKVKWREKYENYGDFAEINGLNWSDRSTKGGDKKTQTKCGKCKKEPVLVKTDVNDEKIFKKDEIAEHKIPTTTTAESVEGDKNAPSDSVDVPVVRKLERARKGLIYQKFMAATYSWNKKEKTSTKNTDPNQPRKRGRPRRVPEEPSKRTKVAADVGCNESTVTVMRLERKKNNGTLKYAVVDRENSKQSSSGAKKT